MRVCKDHKAEIAQPAGSLARDSDGGERILQNNIFRLFCRVFRGERGPNRGSNELTMTSLHNDC